jgi:hypothetical protein
MRSSSKVPLKMKSYSPTSARRDVEIVNCRVDDVNVNIDESILDKSLFFNT